MDIKEFAEIIKERLEKRTGLEVRVEEVMKNNSITLHGINIMVPASNIIPTIYLEQYFQAYEDGMTLEEITDGIINVWEHEKKITQLDMEWFRDFDKVKDKLAYKLVNFESNKELLEKIPYQRVLDLAKVYYVSVKTDEIGEGTILIYNTHLDVWGIIQEQLITIAEENTPKLFPIEISPMSEIVKQFCTSMVMGGEIPEEMLPDNETEVEFRDAFPMYVMSNTVRKYGAATMCYEDALKSFAEKIQSDIFILPSSIHEIIMIPTDEGSDLTSFKDMVYEVNRTQVAVEEVLSDSVYFYNREKDRITIA